MWTIDWIELPLKYTWKLSRNQTDVKFNAIIRYEKNGFVGLGEVAPNIRYHETQERVDAEFVQFMASQSQISCEEELHETLRFMPICPALRFGIESAYIHWMAASTKKATTEILGLLPIEKPVNTSFTLPIMDINDIQNFIAKHNISRFKSLKVKVFADGAAELIAQTQKYYKGSLLIDGNEAWQNPDDLLRLLADFKTANFDLIEQPFPASCIDEYTYLKKHIKLPVIADESLHGLEDVEELQHQFHGINMKLMKAGGYRNGIRLLNQARKMKLKTMIGCMVETGLGISSAMNLVNDIDFVDLDGFLIPQNNPYPLVEEKGGMIYLNTVK